jgi:hypothetical protein
MTVSPFLAPPLLYPSDQAADSMLQPPRLQAAMLEIPLLVYHVLIWFCLIGITWLSFRTLCFLPRAAPLLSLDLPLREWPQPLLSMVNIKASRCASSSLQITDRLLWRFIMPRHAPRWPRPLCFQPQLCRAPPRHQQNRDRKPFLASSLFNDLQDAAHIPAVPC